MAMSVLSTAILLGAAPCGTLGEVQGYTKHGHGKYNCIIHLFILHNNTLLQDKDGNIVPLVNCDYCTREFKNKRAVKAHQRSCPQKPK